MAKAGGGSILFIAVGAGAVLAWQMGVFDKFGVDKDDAGAAAGKTADAGTGLLADITSKPWGWYALVAAGLATLAIMTWRRIGGWGRAAVLILGTIVATFAILAGRS